MSFALDRAVFGAWLDGYKRAWEARDAGQAAALFTADATYRETPFDVPLRGHGAIADYWAKAVSGQKDVSFTYDILAVAGDEGFCRWHAAFTGVPGGAAIDLDGIFHCRFASESAVDRFEEWWHIRVVPPAA